MDWKTGTYLIYLLLSIGLTMWVARTLSRNGGVFLTDVFDGREDLARSVNTLLVVGFYLVNLGFVSLALRTDAQVTSATQAIEQLSVKVGQVLLVIGVLHLLNVLVLSGMRRRRQPPAPLGPLPPAYGYPAAPAARP